MEASKYSGFLPYVYNRVRRRRHGYRELRREASHGRVRKPRRIRVRGARGVSWSVRIARRIKVLSPIRLLKSAKDAYVNMMLALAAKLDVSGNCALQLKGCPPPGRAKGWGPADVNLYLQYLKDAGPFGSPSDGTL